jgi:UDP-N-acetyl-D-galactosamine dehydrogenase
MGITFKENCPDIRNTKIYDVIYQLQCWGITVVVVDPWANESELNEMYNIELGQINCKNKVDSLIVAVGHNEFRSLSPKALRSFCRVSKPVLADVKSIYSKENLLTHGFTVFRL